MSAAETKSPAGRSCGECTLCCKVIGIAALDKPRGRWCQHCEAGVGCRIYERRPEECRSFDCGYLLNPNLDEHWRPSKAKLIVAYRGGYNAVSIHVDPAYPDAWRKEPYFSRIAAWVAAAAAKRLEPVILWQGEKKLALTPANLRTAGR
jgi:hypothetical protein